MSTDLSLGRRSSVADFELIVAGKTYKPVQIAAEFVILDRAADFPAGPATLIVRLDGEERITEITLPDGATTASAEFRISRY